MRVLLATGIYPPEIGGPATFVPVIARFLVAQGHEVTVVTYGDKQTQTTDPWPVVVISRGRFVLSRYLRYAWQVYRRAKKMDVVFVQGAVSEGLPGTVGSLFARVPMILRVPGDYAWESYQHRTDAKERELLDVFVTRSHHGSIWLLEQIERWVAKRAQKIIVPSRYLKGIVIAWGVQSDRIEIAYNDVNPLPKATISREALRAQFGIASEARILFSIARAVPWKGIEFLLSLLSELPSQTVLVVAGDGPLLESWKAEARQQGLEKRAIFLGRWPHAELSNWFQAADAFVLASAYEGFPHVAVEAAMQGLPCFVSDAGGSPETQELFPGRVTVLRYEDRKAWIGALSKDAFSRHASFEPTPQMGKRIEEILKHVATSGH